MSSADSPSSAPTNDDIEAVIQAATSKTRLDQDRPTPPLRDTRTQLFVGNLPYRVRWQDLKDLFRRAGTVLRADVSLGPDNRSRGYGTVLLATAEDAGRAIDMFNGYTWQTRVLEVRPDRLGNSLDADVGTSIAGSAGGAGAGAMGLGNAADEHSHPFAFNPYQETKSLFVGNLPFHVQWQDLKDLFRTAGAVVRADVALGPDGRSRGFGTVSYANEESAERARRMFDGYDFSGRQLKVHYDKFAPSSAPFPLPPGSSSSSASFTPSLSAQAASPALAALAAGLANPLLTNALSPVGAGARSPVFGPLSQQSTGNGSHTAQAEALARALVVKSQLESLGIDSQTAASAAATATAEANLNGLGGLGLGHAALDSLGINPQSQAGLGARVDALAGAIDRLGLSAGAGGGLGAMDASGLAGIDTTALAAYDAQQSTLDILRANQAQLETLGGRRGYDSAAASAHTQALGEFGTGTSSPLPPTLDHSRHNSLANNLLDNLAQSRSHGSSPALHGQPHPPLPGHSISLPHTLTQATLAAGQTPHGLSARAHTAAGRLSGGASGAASPLGSSQAQVHSLGASLASSPFTTESRSPMLDTLSPIPGVSPALSPNSGAPSASARAQSFGAASGARPTFGTVGLASGEGSRPGTGSGLAREREAVDETMDGEAVRIGAAPFMVAQAILQEGSALDIGASKERQKDASATNPRIQQDKFAAPDRAGDMDFVTSALGSLGARRAQKAGRGRSPIGPTFREAALSGLQSENKSRSASSATSPRPDNAQAQSSSAKGSSRPQPHQHPAHPGTISLPPPNHFAMPPNPAMLSPVHAPGSPMYHPGQPAPHPAYAVYPPHPGVSSPLHHPGHPAVSSPLHHPATPGGYGMPHGAGPYMMSMITPHGLPPITPSMPPFTFLQPQQQQPQPAHRSSTRSRASARSQGSGSTNTSTGNAEKSETSADSTRSEAGSAASSSHEGSRAPHMRPQQQHYLNQSPRPGSVHPQQPHPHYPQPQPGMPHAYYPLPHAPFAHAHLFSPGIPLSPGGLPHGMMHMMPLMSPGIPMTPGLPMTPGVPMTPGGVVAMTPGAFWPGGPPAAPWINPAVGAPVRHDPGSEHERTGTGPPGASGESTEGTIGGGSSGGLSGGGMDYFSGVSASSSGGSGGTTGAADFGYFPPIPPSAGSGSAEDVSSVGFKSAGTIAAAARAARRQSENAGRPATGVSTPSGSVVSRDGSAHSTNTGATSVWMASPEEDPKASSNNTASYASVAEKPTYASAMGRSASEHQDDKKMSAATAGAANRNSLLHRPDSDPIVGKLAGRARGEGL